MARVAKGVAADAPATFASRALRFYSDLVSPSVPRGVQVMNPYVDPQARGYVRSFLDQYFADNDPRLLVFGINPGRFGSGVTGVTFTDPVALADFCDIPNPLPRKRELSSVFVYHAIERFGGVREFYRRVFLTAVCPLGFTRAGVNLNYYDVPALERRVTPFIVDSIRKQIALGARTDRAIVIGKGANLKVFEQLNATHDFFRDVQALEHPRSIMQYKRRQLERYLDEYVSVLRG